MIAKDQSSAEDYREIVTSIQFSIGGYFGGFRYLTLSKNEFGAAVEFSNSLLSNEDELIMVPDQISAEEWNLPAFRKQSAYNVNRKEDLDYGKNSKYICSG